MVGVYLMDPVKQKLMAAAGYHVPKELMEFFTQRPLALERSPALLPSWREGRAVWSSDVKADARFDPDWVAALPPHSVLVAPTMAHGQPVGGTYVLPPGYGMFNGTSMATPEAAGSAALLISAAKQAGVQKQPDQIREGPAGVDPYANAHLLVSS